VHTYKSNVARDRAFINIIKREHTYIIKKEQRYNDENKGFLKQDLNICVVIMQHKQPLAFDFNF
jgi:hypothetical protein